MTKEQLESLNIFSIGSKIYPKRYSVPFIGEVDLHENTTIDDIFIMVWTHGKDYGVKQGKSIKIQEIKNVLDIED